MCVEEKQPLHSRSINDGELLHDCPISQSGNAKGHEGRGAYADTAEARVAGEKQAPDGRASPDHGIEGGLWIG